MSALANRHDHLDIIPRDVEAYLRSLPELQGINILNFESGERLDAEKAQFITNGDTDDESPDAKQGIGIIILLARSEVEPCEHSRETLKSTILIIAVEDTELNRESEGGTGDSSRQWALWLLNTLNGYYLEGFMQSQFTPAADGADALAEINFHDEDDVVNRVKHHSCIATAAVFDFHFTNDFQNRATKPAISATLLDGVSTDLNNLLINLVLDPAGLQSTIITYDESLPTPENVNAITLNPGTDSTTTNIKPGQTLVIRAVCTLAGMLPSVASLAVFRLSEDGTTLTQPANSTLT